MMEFNRRGFVFGLAGTAASAWMAAHRSELRTIAEYVDSVVPEQPYDFFTPEEAREFDAISAQIVPTDDTAGAREARVVRFADQYFSTVFKDAQPTFRNDLKLVGDAVAEKTPRNRSFSALSDADQIALLTAFQVTKRSSFNRIRGMTMLGMFSDPMHGGNANKVGWNLIGFEDRYSWAPPFGYYDRV